MDLLNYRDKGGQNPLASILRKDSIVLGITAAIFILSGIATVHSM